MPDVFSASNNQENYFVRSNEQFNDTGSLPLQLGQEIAWGLGQVNRFGLQIGTMSKLKNKPLAIRLQFRYLNYLNSEGFRQNVYGTMLGLTYDFKVDKKR